MSIVLVVNLMVAQHPLLALVADGAERQRLVLIADVYPVDRTGDVSFPPKTEW